VVLDEPRVTVVVPTLTAGPKLAACIESLKRQTLPGIAIVVVDNSGSGRVRREGEWPGVEVIENERNAGFGAAVNQGLRRRPAPFLATLNDDAVARPGWLEALVAAMEADPEVGMCAARVVLADSGRLDSAGMLLCRDGSSKQRGHGRPPEEFGRREEVLLPSGSAALYRTRMLEEIGLFDEAFFLYCEDTDLGLRGRWAGWRCVYVPEAVAEHHYSQSAGRASRLKAYLVERNRVFLVLKNFPAGMLMSVPYYAIQRYFWHFAFLLRGRGTASEFQSEGNHPLALVWYVVKAHLEALASLGRLLRQRAAVRRAARIDARAFRRLAAAHSISPRQVAEL